MEDASKAIELAVGAIIFVIALTIAILLYNKLADTANTAININETQNSVTFNKNEIQKDFGFIYTSTDIYALENELENNKIEYGNPTIEKKGGYTDPSDVNNIIAVGTYTLNNASKYRVDFEYEYNEVEGNNLNKHRIKKVSITEYKG